MASVEQAVIDTGIDNTMDQDFLDDVIGGLSKSQKTLPCKYFYDEKGSQLFEQICETPEYYVTRTERQLYRHYAAEMAEYIGDKALIIEPGAGSVKKIALLLAALDNPAGFIPMDISPEMLQHSSEALSQQFPQLDINPVVADFLDQAAVGSLLATLPAAPMVNKRVIFFPGSTIGNFSPDDAQAFLNSFASQLKPGDGLLIGVDLIKDIDILENAYNDAEGVTANFNLNLLQRINSELKANFLLENFDHKALFNQEKHRIEMHLISEVKQKVELADQVIHFDQHETIHTENSYKYSINTFSVLADKAGFKHENSWQDPKGLFGVHYFSVY
ncbi:MAG: L-histidine N(alpha)-methyltransferase [Pseudomonadota bacterium]